MSKWQALKDYHSGVDKRALLSLFDEAGRAEDFSLGVDGLLFDYSKTNIDSFTRDLLLKLAEASGVAEKRAAMFSGEKINDTEGRAVLHTALRAGPSGGDQG